MRLNGDQCEEVQKALLSAFTDHEQLEMLVRFGLNQRLPEIAGTTDLQYSTFRVIDWAESHGELDKLIAGACRINPGNLELQMLQQHYPLWKEQFQSGLATGTVEQQKQWFAAQMGLPLSRLKDEQIAVYKRVWNSLVALRKQGDQLWQEASPANLLSFSDQLAQTIEVVETNALLFDDGDYQNLDYLLKRLGAYRAGKMRLINIRTREDYMNFGASHFYHDQRTQIEMNHLLKEDYEQVMMNVRSQFRRTLFREQ